MKADNEMKADDKVKENNTLVTLSASTIYNQFRYDRNECCSGDLPPKKDTM